MDYGKQLEHNRIFSSVQRLCRACRDWRSTFCRVADINRNAGLAFAIFRFYESGRNKEYKNSKVFALLAPASALAVLAIAVFPLFSSHNDAPGEPYDSKNSDARETTAVVVAVQPNVPMAGLNRAKWSSLRARQTALAAVQIKRLRMNSEYSEDIPITVILPESPMNFQYEEDSVFRSFINTFAKRNDVSVLFNSAEPDRRREHGYFNSAVLVSAKGEKVDQYDKIHLLPFGEFVPLPEFAQGLIPPMVGRFSFGEEYDLLQFGEAKAGVMICFESHFPSLSREFVKKGADVLIEMTNDGYLGPTPVLRQHLASAAFRAAETNRPVLRVTNVGVTAYIDGSGGIHDIAGNYTEATRVWNIKKSDGHGTFSLRFGDWVAWFCLTLGIGLILFVFWSKRGDGN